MDLLDGLIPEEEARRAGWIVFCETLFSKSLREAFTYPAFLIYNAGYRYGKHKSGVVLPPSEAYSRVLDGRKRRGMTQQQFADAAGISRTYLSQIEHGAANNVSYALMVRLLDEASKTA